jgi:hypothetical protein
MLNLYRFGSIPRGSSLAGGSGAYRPVSIGPLGAFAFAAVFCCDGFITPNGE